MQTSTKFKIVAVIAIIAGPFLAYNGYQEKERLAKLEKEGITVDGIIESGESSKSRKSRSYHFEVSFAPQGGSPTKKNFAVKSDFFKAHTNESSIVSPEVKVRYLAGDVDESAVIVGGSTDTTINFVVGIAAFVGGLGLLLFFFLRRG